MSHLLITGGHGAIGSAIAALFKSEGYQVTAPGSKDLDLSTDSGLDAFFAALKTPVNALVYAAGINDPKPIEAQTLADLNRTLAVNSEGFFLMAQRVSEGMKKMKNGAILGISSLFGTVARKGRLPYVASKHAMNGMVKTMAIEWGPYNLRVNTLSPGFVDTPMTRKNNSQDVIDGLLKFVPMGRMAMPDDIARVAYFLCSKQNSYITGQDIIVDGGFSAGGFLS